MFFEILGRRRFDQLFGLLFINCLIDTIRATKVEKILLGSMLKKIDGTVPYGRFSNRYNVHGLNLKFLLTYARTYVSIELNIDIPVP